MEMYQELEIFTKLYLSCASVYGSYLCIFDRNVTQHSDIQDMGAFIVNGALSWETVIRSATFEDVQADLKFEPDPLKMDLTVGSSEDPTSCVEGGRA